MTQLFQYTPFQLFDIINADNIGLFEENIPESIGFEYHLGENRSVDSAYYYSCEKVKRLMESNLINQKHSNDLLKITCHKLASDKVLTNFLRHTAFGGAWLEFDADKLRTQVYIEVGTSNANDKYGLLQRWNQTVSLEMSVFSTITYIGFVYIGGKHCGLKILCQKPMGNTLKKVGLLNKYAELTMSTLQANICQFGYSYTTEGLHAISVEIDIPKSKRYSGKAMWNKLLSDDLFCDSGWIKRGTTVDHLYHHRVSTQGIQVSGINHIKYSIDCSNSTVSSKLYAGIINSFTSSYRIKE